MINEKKEHIINTAVELFAEKGFEGSSIRDLAARAGVNVAMMNYYFGSKDKLFEAIVEFKAAYMRGRLDEIAADEKLSPTDKINAVIDSYVNKIVSHPSFHKLLYQELMVTEREAMHQSILAIFQKNRETVSRIIEDGIKKKVFRKVDIKLTMATLMGTINQVMLSKAMCRMLMEGDETFDPYTSPEFKSRLVKHLRQLMHALLLNK